MDINPFSQAASFMRAQPWFGSLSPDRQNDVLESVVVSNGDKGQILLHAGEPVRGWYAVLDGLVKLESRSSEGRFCTFLGVASGDWFGEGSALKTEPRRYDVIALRDSTLMCLKRSEFDALRSNSLAFNQFLVSHLNRRLGQTMAIIEASRTHSLQQRVAMYLTRIFWPGRKRVNLSQEELANLIGLSRQTVNRILQDLEKMDLISLKFGRIEIRDEDALFAQVASTV